jgi:rhodanese-related sulfurtransferase
MPPAPDHFSRCSEVNRKGPARLASLAPLKPLDPTAFQKALQGPNAMVLDIRDFGAFGGNHIPGALHVDFGGNFATFCGWLIEPDSHLYLVADNPNQAREAAIWLRRVGLDVSPGYLEGGMFAWAAAGFPLAHVRQMGADEVNAAVREAAMAIVDVRSSSEFAQRHIQNAINIPAPELRTRYRELDPGRPILVICGSGQRSSMGASLIKQRGFREVWNAAGGMTGYAAAGFSPECPLCVAPHGPRFIGKNVG